MNKYLKKLLCGGLCLAMLGGTAAYAAGGQSSTGPEAAAAPVLAVRQGKCRLGFENGRMTMKLTYHPVNRLEKDSLTVMYAHYDENQRLCQLREGTWSRTGGVWEFDVAEFPQTGTVKCFFWDRATTRPVCASLTLTADDVKTDHDLDDDNLGEWT